MPDFGSENTSGRCVNFQILVDHIEQTIAFSCIVAMSSLLNSVISLLCLRGRTCHIVL